MAKKKAPARKGGAKKCAPKKAVKRKPIPQQVVEQATEKRLFLGKQALEMRGHGDCTDFTVAVVDRPAHPTVEEQFERERLEKALANSTLLGRDGLIKPSFLRRVANRVKRAFRFRSAKTGEFVSQAEAEASPDTTVRERVK